MVAGETHAVQRTDSPMQRAVRGRSLQAERETDVRIVMSWIGEIVEGQLD